LLALSAGFLLPVAGLFTYQVYSASAQAVAEAERGALVLAQVMAAEYDAFVRETERTLRALAQRPQVRAMDPAHCDPFLSEIHSALPLFANVAVMTRDFTIICSAVPQPAGKRASAAQVPGAAPALDRKGLFVSEPFVGPITGQQVFSMSYPILAADGSVAGRVGLPVDVERWQSLVGQWRTPAGSTFGVVSAKGALLARYPPAPELLGRSIAGNEVVQRALTMDNGVATGMGVDGVRRVFGVTTVPDVGWRVYAGRPHREVLAPVYAGALRSTGVLAVALSLLGLFVALLYQWLGRSVAILNSMTEAMVRDDTGARVSDSGPRELRDAIASFNTTVALRRGVEAALRRNEEVLRMFVEHTPAAVAMFDRDMKCLAVSRRWLADHNRPGEGELEGRSRYEIFSDLPGRWDEIHRRCLAGAVERAEADPFPRADGSTDWVRWEARPWRTADGSIGGLILFSEVITERVRAQEALRESERRLLELIGQGLTNRQIAEEMFLAEKTIKNYVSNLLAKLGLERRTQAAVFATKHLPPKR